MIDGEKQDKGKSGVGVPSRRKVERGARIFVVATALGLLFVLHRSSVGDSISHLRMIRLPLLFVCGALVLVDWFAGGARIWVFVKHVYPGVSFFGCVRASLANVFLGGVTPSQTGGGPGQIYVLYKEGVPGYDATVISFIASFLGTTAFFPACALFVTAFYPPSGIDEMLRHIVTATVGVFGFICLLIVIGVASPKPIPAGVRLVSRLVPPLYRLLERKGAFDTVDRLLTQYYDTMWFFLRRAWYVFPLGFLLTVVIYLNKFAVAYVVIRGLNLDASFWTVIYAQLVLMLIFYFAPSPGAAGVAEVSAAAVMGGIVPTSYQAVFVVLWRFFTLYLSLLVGAMFTVRAIYKPRIPQAGS